MIKDSKRVIAKITVEAYLVNKIRANILISNNLIILEKIKLNLANNFMLINSY